MIYEYSKILKFAKMATFYLTDNVASLIQILR
jgi:hypothetical protein